MTTAQVALPSRTQPVSRPGFFGVLGGELYKLTHTRIYAIMLFLAYGPTLVVFAIYNLLSNTKDRLIHDTTQFFVREMSAALSVNRIFLGFFIIAATAFLIGQEYQQGTIRVLLGRGIGRMQLLSAKLAALAITALAAFGLALVLDYVLTVIGQLIAVGNLDYFTALPGDFWHMTVIYALTVLISLGASIAMATGISVLARSIAGAVGGSLSFFPADNVLTTIFLLTATLSQNNNWLDLSAYLLGPNLNTMGSLLAPTFGTPPVHAAAVGASWFGVVYDGNHTLGVTLVYSLVFLVTAFVLIARRDVKE